MEARFPCWLSCLKAVALIGALAAAAPAQADFVNFDTAGDLTTKFSVNGPFGQSASGGITGGSVVSNSGDYQSHSAIYGTAFAPVGLALELYFKHAGYPGGPSVRLGFVASPGFDFCTFLVG